MGQLISVAVAAVIGAVPAFCVAGIIAERFGADGRRFFSCPNRWDMAWDRKHAHVFGLDEPKQQ